MKSSRVAAGQPDQVAGQAKDRRRAHWKLLAMVVVLSLPVAVAFWAYWQGTTAGRLEWGELIDPPRPVGALQGRDLQGKERSLATLKGQWLLVSVQPGACPPACQERLRLLHQLRETLGKDKDRVDAVWLVPHGQPLAQGSASWGSDFQILQVSPTDVGAWLPAADGDALDTALFVVDPLGNAMARFPANYDSTGARKVRRVLERLLRASVAWDAPGR